MHLPLGVVVGPTALPKRDTDRKREDAKSDRSALGATECRDRASIIGDANPKPAGVRAVHDDAGTGSNVRPDAQASGDNGRNVSVRIRVQGARRGTFS